MPQKVDNPAAADGAPAESPGVKSARRAVDLIETFAANDVWLSLSDLHARTGFPRSSLHGLLRTLLEAGWLEADANTARYRLGVRALICGTAYLDRDAVVPFATEALERIREKTGFTAHFARRNGTEVVYLETRESQRSTHLVSRVGRTLPAHATALGKALLAELTHDEIEALMPADADRADAEHHHHARRPARRVRRDPRARVRRRDRGRHAGRPVRRRGDPLPDPGHRRDQLLDAHRPGDRRRRPARRRAARRNHRRARAAAAPRRHSLTAASYVRGTP